MNETDKMLADMLASLENGKKTTDISAQALEESVRTTNNEIDAMLFDLRKFVVKEDDGFVLIDCSKVYDLENFYICKHQVTQKEYFEVMGINPSFFQINNNFLFGRKLEYLKYLQTTENNPVENVSWYDAIYYCNTKSIMKGLAPAYSVNGEINPQKWDYQPCKGNVLKSPVSFNKNSDGYRLPDLYEWKYAAKGKERFKFAGSKKLNDVGWYYDNSGDITSPVMEKKANAFGIYDMCGNVDEWCWDDNSGTNCYYCGGSCHSSEDKCKVDSMDRCPAECQNYYRGFRVVCSASGTD